MKGVHEGVHKGVQEGVHEGVYKGVHEGAARRKKEPRAYSKAAVVASVLLRSVKKLRRECDEIEEGM
jgi:hypothetical protein